MNHSPLLACILVSCTSSLQASTIIGQTTGTPPCIPGGLYTVCLTPPTVEHLSSSSNNVYGDLSTLRNRYNDSTEWQFAPGGPDSSGTFNVLQYSPFIADGEGGANFSVVYDDGVAAPADNYEWIQIAFFHNWGDVPDGTAVDTKRNFTPFYGDFTPWLLPKITTDDLTPFITDSGAIWQQGSPDYPATKFQDPVAQGKVPGGDLLFVDQPVCPLSCADKDGTAYVYFDLFLVNYTWNGQMGAKAGGQVDILDGLRWGVEISKAPATFDNPGNTPEPASCATIGSGLIFFLGWYFRRRAQTAKELC